MTTPRRLVASISLALVFPAPLATQQSPFTIEQVMGAPFPDELTAAPTGGAVAWVFNTRGARNIWVAAPPDYAGRVVTAYAEDDGQEVGDLRWTPDTRAIVFVRGGSPNEKGEYPNPHSLVAGVEQAVWVVPVAGGSPRRIGEGHAPAVSPKGDHVALLRRGQVWWASLADTLPAEQLIHARGTARSLLWSPDGRRIAFLRNPAGAERLPFTPQRAGQPWSIRVAEVASGAGRQVWIAASGPGSVFREVVADYQIRWEAGDRIVFPWEKDGWTHL